MRGSGISRGVSNANGESVFSNGCLLKHFSICHSYPVIYHFWVSDMLGLHSIEDTAAEPCGLFRMLSKKVHCELILVKSLDYSNI